MTSAAPAQPATGASAADDSVLAANPYASHPALSPLESDVLWEYAKTARLIKKLAALAKELGGRPNEALLAQLRLLERKMGLVLTLFKASVWAVIVEGEEAEAEMLAKQEREDAEAGVAGPSGVIEPGGSQGQGW